MSIRICTHCYAGKLQQYAVFLQYQLSSLVLHPCKIPVHITVCFTPEDQRTSDVMAWFGSVRRPDNLSVSVMPLEPGELFRRCIGRNRVSLDSHETIVWHADVDQTFGAGCLDALWDMWDAWRDKPVMIYPRHILIQKEHKLGDAVVAQTPQHELVDIDIRQFAPKRYTRPVGGVHITNGDFARQHGYLHGNSKWQRARTDGKPFRDFRDDVAYRKYCERHGRVHAVELPGLYRLRHTQVTYR